MNLFWSSNTPTKRNCITGAHYLGVMFYFEALYPYPYHRPQICMQVKAGAHIDPWLLKSWYLIIIFIIHKLEQETELAEEKTMLELNPPTGYIQICRNREKDHVQSHSPQTSMQKLMQARQERAAQSWVVKIAHWSFKWEHILMKQGQQQYPILVQQFATFPKTSLVLALSSPRTDGAFSMVAIILPKPTVVELLSSVLILFSLEPPFFHVRVRVPSACHIWIYFQSTFLSKIVVGQDNKWVGSDPWLIQKVTARMWSGLRVQARQIDHEDGLTHPSLNGICSSIISGKFTYQHLTFSKNFLKSPSTALTKVKPVFSCIFLQNNKIPFPQTSLSELGVWSWLKHMEV